MEDQYRLGALLGCQVAPEFVERYMLLLPATAILFPSADAATELQLMPGPVFVQVWANPEFALHKTAVTSSRFFMDFICRAWTNQPLAGYFGKLIFRRMANPNNIAMLAGRGGWIFAASRSPRPAR
jgi:hypothetical protein